MRILVLGATGGTGREVVRQGLDTGHEMSAFVRDPAGVDEGLRRARIISGRIDDAAAVASAVAGHDALVCCLGRGKSLRSEGLIEGSLRVVVPAMQAAGVRRFLMVSAFGVGESRADAPPLPRLLHRLLLFGIFADKEAGERLVRASSLDWTIAYPVLLTNGPLTGRYRTGERLTLRGMPKVSRADVAHFLLRELREAAWMRKVVVLADSAPA